MSTLKIFKNNPFTFSNDNKRYHTLAYHNKITFGKKIFKAVIDAGFTCPNKDGTKGIGGCIFCSDGSGYFTNSSIIPIKTQIKTELERIHKKNPKSKAIAYFQANTNTYADVKKLQEIYTPILSYEDIIGISIGTRADCLSDDIVEFLSELSKETYLTVELGMQTVHEKTIEFINRGYSHDIFLEGYQKLKSKGIRTCIHIINGLPGEKTDDMIETVKQAGLLFPNAVKIQLLHIIKGTALEKYYNQNMFKAMDMESYVKTVVSQLEYLPPETVIERITGDGDKSKLIEPLWSTNKLAILGAIDKLQAETNSFQGKKIRKNEKNT